MPTFFLTLACILALNFTLTQTGGSWEAGPSLPGNHTIYFPRVYLSWLLPAFSVWGLAVSLLVGSRRFHLPGGLQDQAGLAFLAAAVWSSFRYLQVLEPSQFYANAGNAPVSWLLIPLFGMIINLVMMHILWLKKVRASPVVSGMVYAYWVFQTCF